MFLTIEFWASSYFNGASEAMLFASGIAGCGIILLRSRDRKINRSLRKDIVMPVVTLSSDSHPLGREIAVGAATALGYDCVDREILSAVADRQDVPETDLHKALDEAPSPFGISSQNPARNLAYIEEAH